ncbi:cyanophycinase [soil metagenome]
MKNKLLIILILISSFGASSPLPTVFSEQDRGKLFLMGGGSRPPEMIARIITEAGLKEGGYGLILPMASAEPDSAIFYGKAQFSDQNVNNIFGFNYRSGNINKVSLDSIVNARLIYIAGGDQNRFMEFVSETPLKEAIHEAFNKGAVIAGTSAGAAVMGALMITGNELRYPEYSPTYNTIETSNLELKPGLGILQNVLIDQHFVKRSRHNRLLTAVLEFPELTGIGIDEATALLIQGGEAEVIGESQVLVFNNPKKSTTIVNDKLGGRDINLNIYLPGEKFELF